jgi:hypothetical protein
MELLGKSRTVDFNGRKVEVRELTIRQIVSLSSQLARISRFQPVFEDLAAKDNARVIRGILSLVRTVPGELASFVAVALPRRRRLFWTVPAVTKRDILDATPEQVVDLVTAIVEVNNLGEMFKKKVLEPVRGLSMTQSPSSSTARDG